MPLRFGPGSRSAVVGDAPSYPSRAPCRASNRTGLCSNRRNALACSSRRASIPPVAVARTSSRPLRSFPPALPPGAPGRRCAPAAGPQPSQPPTAAPALTPPSPAGTAFKSSCKRPPSWSLCAMPLPSHPRWSRYSHRLHAGLPAPAPTRTAAPRAAFGVDYPAPTPSPSYLAPNLETGRSHRQTCTSRLRPLHSPFSAPARAAAT